MLEFVKNKKIMVVVAHPDDEVLGIGSTIHKMVHEQNCEAIALILGEGLTSRSDSRDEQEWEDNLKTHHQNIQNAAKHIGYKDVITYNFADNRFDSIDLLDIIKAIEKEKNSYQPDIIFTHHGGDVNIDHQRTFQSVITACRPMENEVVKTIIAFETASGTEWRASSDPFIFSPNLFMPVDEHQIIAKCKAMEEYEFEKRTYPHPRSSDALKIQAQRWGIAIGKPFAEAFQLIRSI